jgi:hypothetical protein
MPATISNMSEYILASREQVARLSIDVAAHFLDYSCVIISSVALISGILWVTKGRKTYQGPVRLSYHTFSIRHRRSMNEVIYTDMHPNRKWTWESTPLSRLGWR